MNAQAGAQPQEAQMQQAAATPPQDSLVPSAEQVFVERLYPGMEWRIAVDRVRVAPHIPAGGKQELFLFDNRHFGTILAIDNVVQFATRDRSYPEVIAHAVMNAHQHRPRTPRRALIVGGGDGELGLELLKYTEPFGPLREIVIVDIDPEVTRLMKNHLPEIGKCAIRLKDETKTLTVFEDPRVKWIHEDARKFVHRSESKYDIIICDTTDEQNVAVPLFDLGFLKDVKKVMSNGAVLARLAGSISMQLEEVKKIVGQSFEVFGKQSTALMSIPVSRYFGGMFGVVCSTLATHIHLDANAYVKQSAPYLQNLAHYSLRGHRRFFSPEPWVVKELGLIVT